MKNIISFILIAAAIWIFWSYTSPIYKEAGGLKEVRADYKNKLAQANEFQKKYENLLAEYQSFSGDNLARLSRLAPDKVDAIRLIIEVGDIAAKQNLLIKNIKISEPAKETADVANQGFNSTDLSFSVTGGYEQFIVFLQDLEKSLRILDVISIKFDAADVAKTGNYTFDVTLRTYWLK